MGADKPEARRRQGFASKTGPGGGGGADTVIGRREGRSMEAGMYRRATTNADRAGGPSRRQVLGQFANGFGMLAAADLLSREAAGATAPTNPLVVRAAHYAPKAKRVIFMFMSGGPSH